MKRSKNSYLDKLIRNTEGNRFLSLNYDDKYIIALFFSMAIVGILSPVGFFSFAVGLNLGLGMEKLFLRKREEMISRFRQQDLIDLRTLHDLAENMSYKMLHEREKSGLN